MPRQPRRESCFMKRIPLCLFACVAALLIGSGRVEAHSLTWNQVKTRYEATNPALKADADRVGETRALKITAGPLPNPQVDATLDGVQIAPDNCVSQRMQGAFVSPSISDADPAYSQVRDNVTCSIQHEGTSLFVFLNARGDYRQVQLAYTQLVGANLSAVSQLNLAVGREVIP